MREWKRALRIGHNEVRHGIPVKKQLVRMKKMVKKNEGSVTYLIFKSAIDCCPLTELGIETHLPGMYIQMMCKVPKIFIPERLFKRLESLQIRRSCSTTEMLGWVQAILILISHIAFCQSCMCRYLITILCSSHRFNQHNLCKGLLRYAGNSYSWLI